MHLEEALTGNITKARVDAFHRRHGGVCYSDGVFYFYPDGAYRDVNALGLLADPSDSGTPEAEFKNATNICTHYRLKMEKAVAKFDDLNTRLAHTMPGDPQRELAELARLQGIVDECRKEFQAAERKLNSTAVAKRRAEVKQAEEDRKEKFQAFQEQRRKIRV